MIRNWDMVQKAMNGLDGLEVSVEFEPYDEIMLRPDYLLELFSGKKVIHLGCTDHTEIIQRKMDTGQYLHSLISYVSEKCIGIDINQEALEYIRSRGIRNVMEADITQPGISEILESHFDYILLGEMLEHIENPVDFLKDIVANYGSHIDNFVITVPNAFGLPFLANAYSQGREALNPDHKYWFTPYTIMKVVHQAGLKVHEVQMCLYENSKCVLPANANLLKSKPLLLDTIVVICGAA